MASQEPNDVDMDINEVLGLIAPKSHEALNDPSQIPQAATKKFIPQEEPLDDSDLYDPLAGDEMDGESGKPDQTQGQNQLFKGETGQVEEQDRGVEKAGNHHPPGKSTALAGLLEQYSDEESEPEEAEQSEEGKKGVAPAESVDAQEETRRTENLPKKISGSLDPGEAPHAEDRPSTKTEAHLENRIQSDKNDGRDQKTQGDSKEQRDGGRGAGASGRALEERPKQASDRAERRGNERREERQASGKGGRLGESRHEEERRQETRDHRIHREWRGGGSGRQNERGGERRQERGYRDRREPASFRGGPRDASERGGSSRGEPVSFRGGPRDSSERGRERSHRLEEPRDKREQRNSRPPADKKSAPGPPPGGKEGNTGAGVDLNEAVRAAAAAAARSAKLAASRAPLMSSDPTEAAAKAAEMVNQTLMIQNAVLQQKRKMLWGDKKATTEETGTAATGGTNRWDAVAVGDSERTHKFQKLMFLSVSCLATHTGTQGLGTAVTTEVC